MSDLGALFAQNQQTPVPTTAQPADLESQWKGWLDNPANKAGLISFGLQAMTGSWGNGAAQLATAIGSGLETAAGAQKIEQDRQLAERKRAEAQSEHADNMAFREKELKSREKIANIMASTKLDVANIRAGAAGSGLNSAKLIMSHYDKVKRDVMRNMAADPNNFGKDPAQLEQIANGIAEKSAEEFSQTLGGYSGQQNTSPNTSENPANVSPSGPSSATGQTGKITSTNNANAQNLLTVEEVLKDPIRGPLLRSKIANGGKEQIKKFFKDPENLDTIQRVVPTTEGFTFPSEAMP